MRKIIFAAFLSVSAFAATDRKVLLNKLVDNTTKAQLATSAEVSRLTGVTGAIQTQLDSKATIASVTAKVSKAGDTMSGRLDNSAGSFVVNSTSQLFGFGAAGLAPQTYVQADNNGDMHLAANASDKLVLSTNRVTVPDLTINRAVVSDNFKGLASATTTSTELDYLSGTTANVQTQINDLKFSPQKSVVLYEDFLVSGPIVGSTIAWQDSAVGTGAAVNYQSPGTGFDTEVPLNYPGTVKLATGTDSTGLAILQQSNLESYPFVYGFGAITIQMNVKFPIASTGVQEYTARVGLQTNTDSDPPEGAYFRYRPGSANWQCVTKKGAVETETDSGIAVLTGSGDTFQALRIVSNTAATSFAFSIDTGSGFVAACTHTTNLPVGVNSFGKQVSLNAEWFIQKTAGTSDRVMYADYFYGTQTLTRR